MKTEDFNRLKEICEKEGFEVNWTWDHSARVSIIQDPWEGVEFVEVIENGIYAKKGQIFKITETDSSKLSFINPYYKVGKLDNQDGVWISQGICKPSTEQAYFQQLKKESLDRFGLIKFGDKFQRDFEAVRDKRNVFCIGDQGYIADGFSYDKENDALMYDGHFIYKQGKWATKLPERVKVEFKDDSWDDYGDYVEIGFVFKLPKVYAIKRGSGEHLAKQLENYLNDETNIIS